MTTYEYRIIVNEELYTDNPLTVTSEIMNMAYGQLSKEVPNADREKMEFEVGILDERTMSRTIRVTYRDDAPEEPETQGPALDMCPYCGQEGFCPCGDQASPREEEVEAII